MKERVKFVGALLHTQITYVRNSRECGGDRKQHDYSAGPKANEQGPSSDDQGLRTNDQGSRTEGQGPMTKERASVKDL